MTATTATIAPNIGATAIAEFAGKLRGELIAPADPHYDEARKVYSGMIDRHPAMIARCVDAGDVISAVNFARENNLLVAVRGGGHHGAGFGVCDNGLVIDLSPMKGVRVDPGTRTARVAGGSTLGDVDHATHAFGLATPSGIVSTTGVGGITLGGGVGYLTRKCGLAIDNLLEADVVLADGHFVTASEEENADLFWALRGGGGNFGVVTSFVFNLHPIDTVYAGPMLWDFAQAPEVLRWYREFITQAPDDLYGFFAFLVVPPAAPFPEEFWNQQMCGIVWCYTGPLEHAEAVFAPIRNQFGAPALDWVAPITHPALQSMFDALYPPGMQWYWKADFVAQISDEAIARHVEFGPHMPTWRSTMHLYPINGAAGRVAKDATAWNYRDSTWVQVMGGISPDPADNERMIAWTREYWEAMHPYSAGGAYVNMFMEEGQERVRAAYGTNYERLATIKAQYDPTNLFRMNQNIKPATSTAQRRRGRVADFPPTRPVSVANGSASIFPSLVSADFRTASAASSVKPPTNIARAQTLPRPWYCPRGVDGPQRDCICECLRYGYSTVECQSSCFACQEHIKAVCPNPDQRGEGIGPPVCCADRKPCRRVCGDCPDCEPFPDLL